MKMILNNLKDIKYFFVLIILLYSCSGINEVKKFNETQVKDTSLINVYNHYFNVSDCEKITILDSMIRECQYLNENLYKTINSLPKYKQEEYFICDYTRPDLSYFNGFIDDSIISIILSNMKNCYNDDYQILLLDFISYFQHKTNKAFFQEPYTEINQMKRDRYKMAYSDLARLVHYMSISLYEGNLLILKDYFGCDTVITSEKYFIDIELDSASVANYIKQKYKFYKLDTNSLIIKPLLPSYIYNVEFYTSGKWNYFNIQLYIGNNCWDYNKIQKYYDQNKSTFELYEQKKKIVHEKSTMMHLGNEIKDKAFQQYYYFLNSDYPIQGLYNHSIE